MGTQLVPAIGEELRGDVVILSNTPLSEEIRQHYETLGVSRFCLRGKPFLELVRSVAPSASS